MNKIVEEYSQPNGPDVLDRMSTGRGYQRRDRRGRRGDAAGDSKSSRPPPQHKSARQCSQCAAEFQPRDRRQHTCGSPACASARAAAYRETHRDQQRAYNKQYRRQGSLTQQAHRMLRELTS
jgi:hypothetical protein